MHSSTHLKLVALLEAHKNKNKATLQHISQSETNSTNAKIIIYNEAQNQAIDLISKGKSAVLIGAAGTGKTTVMKGALQALIESKILPAMSAHSHKHLPNIVESYGIAIYAYTRRATNNIRKNLPEKLKDNCITIHKLLEFEPEYLETFDSETGKNKKTMRFIPKRNKLYPIPSCIHTVVIEESSMCSLELFELVLDACPHVQQFVFLGDIQQLPPVFGSAILGYKMLEHPVIELKEVHRQALDSPILALAHRVLSGKPIEHEELKSMNVPDKLKIITWAKKVEAEYASAVLSKYFIKALDSGEYNPETDAILIPFNKSCGTIELNNSLASAIAKSKNLLVHEIVVGFIKIYLAEGVKCLYDKEDCIVTSIEPNLKYTGKPYKEASISLDFYGNLSTNTAQLQNLNNCEHADPFESMSDLFPSYEEEADNVVKQSSHVITLKLLDTEQEIKISTVGDLNKLILGYAITVHKSQGSEFDKVFLCLHNSHSTMTYRELLYTAITRAKKSLVIFCEPNTFIKGINTQRVPGQTLLEKAEFFKGKLNSKINFN